MGKKRRQFGTEDKLSILKRHFIGKEKISDICEDLDIHPNQFHRWQGELFSGDSSFFKDKKSSNNESREIKKLQDDNVSLTRIIEKKDMVIAEITEEYVRLKKKNLP